MPNFSLDSHSNYTDPSVRLDIMPDVMHDYSSRHMRVVIDNITEAWQTIDGTWRQLLLSWTGDSAEAAEEFNQRLWNVQKALFGEKESGTPGILAEIRGATMVASVNYGDAEVRVTEMFDKFLDSLTGTPQPGASLPKSETDGPIGVSYDTGPNTLRYDNRDVIGSYEDEYGALVLVYEGDKPPKGQHVGEPPEWARGDRAELPGWAADHRTR